MTNSRAKGLRLLKSHTATGTETSFLYTPATAITQSKYSQIIFTVTGDVTAALAINMKINGLTANYSHNGSLHKSDATSTELGETAQALQVLASATLLAGADYDFAIQGNIQLTASAGIFITSFSTAQNCWTEQIHAQQSSATTITSIEILVSTSSWKAGTTITIHGVMT